VQSRATDTDIIHPYQLVSENREDSDEIGTTFKPNIPQRMNTKMVNILNYTTRMGYNLRAFFQNEKEKKINQLIKSDLKNHDYIVSRKKLIPHFKLYERLRPVTSLYPKPLKSFIDIGCYRGFYALDAASRPGCNISVGIDVYEPFIHASNIVRDYLGQKNSSFYMASINMVSTHPEAYGGPFQTVLIIGLYHYLFWGSRLCSDAYGSHYEIFQMLSRICTERLIISGRLEIDQLPRIEKEKAKAKASGKFAQYNTDYFLRVAREFFEVHQVGSLGKYPLFVMEKKNA